MRHVIITEGENEKTYDVPDVESWSVVAKDIAQRLKPGTVVGLSGELGAGKTTFVQALGLELGVQKSPQSPTFALMRSYPITNHQTLKRLVHVDAYRFEKPEEADVLDLEEELSDRETAIVIEWPEKMGTWMRSHSAQLIHLKVSLV